MIELRSDTFTLPTDSMRAAITQAVLGDDVYGEDPTVRRLEELAASICGKENSCLMPSGTMANLVALLVHCPRGFKALVGNESDIYIYEAGGASVCGSIMYEPIPTQPDGSLLISDLAAAMPEERDDPQYALPALLCLENTHNRCGGVVLDPTYLRRAAAFAHEQQMNIHLDGARIFHAATALRVGVAELVHEMDSLQFCLSKGLAAPIGSMLVGSRSFIEQARRMRKMLGGGMRQAGIIAAAGLVALEQMTDRLEEDHRHARLFAERLAEWPEIAITLKNVQTNIVLFKVIHERFTSKTVIEAAHQRGLNLSELGHGNIRAVFHYGITEKNVEQALEIISGLLHTTNQG
ncbi:threonine aldolase [Ktedonosporobacter rubrisoli]|uniref:Threonine aldolase n=1 Tax=Ktedonosporobacter rubrisoli TaxID=2509675 RepID=A0A4P6JPF1_KTERU|nr:GntG family PLP-dependent aldolase [Ktedonosporobacter rubrisoli]QBD77258.1 threonine aldolase [Ktedonosporobacter rubrisoli]